LQSYSHERLVIVGDVVVEMAILAVFVHCVRVTGFKAGCPIRISEQVS
jgi:hypothetical protein